MPQPTPTSHVGCELAFDLTEGTTLAVQVAIANPASESIVATLDGQPLEPIEVDMGGGERIHLFDAPIAGRLDLRYAATSAPADPRRVSDADAMVAMRQSRYCPSDALEGFAGAEFGQLPRDDQRAGVVAAWVFERIRYTPGASGPLTDALDTLGTGTGVCRDFAHLTITLCRALGIPARMVAAYAPGLSPMDFHAVVEVRTDTGWQILDPTRLAPRQSLVRIATGRDAADTAFATTLRGDARLVSTSVTAVVDGDLPLDDHRSAVHLA